MNEYDVSVIIPVYNCEKYIKDCVKSIQNQDYPTLNKIQVLLINDGSRDNSLNVCNEIEKTVKDIKIEVISKKNGGVSSARNVGIKNAKGKYMLFIDSDDFLSKSAIRKLVGFFDKNYDKIDLVSYPLYEYNSKSKRKKMLNRYKEFAETKIFDLSKDYWAIQPTMNVMVKNLYQDNILFDEKVNFHEDMLYNTEIIVKKLRMGYVREAKYYYRIYDNSATNYKENPLYSFEQFMYVAEKLFDRYKENNIPTYVQRVILNVIRYRILKDKLFPYYLEGEEWKQAYERIVNLIKRIDNDNIMQYKIMNKYHKMYLMKLKEEEIIIHHGHSRSYSINDKNDNIIISENNVEVSINRLKFKNNKIFILGVLKSTLFEFIKPNLRIDIIYNDDTIKTQELQLFETISSRFQTDIKVANFYRFECELDTEEIKRFDFKIEIDKVLMKKKFYFNFWSPFSNKIKIYKLYSGIYRLEFKNNEFYICKTNREIRKKDFKETLKKYNQINKRVNFFRILARVFHSDKKRIWLYYDRKNVFDNGYIQYKHDVAIKDDIHKYYVLDGDIKKYKKRFKGREWKNVIKFGSLKHKILFLNSDKILTSFSSLQEYCPFFRKYECYKDMLKYDLIYLQHGILHASLLRMYAKSFTPIDKFIISSNFEKENLIKNYEYSENDLIESGMPRLEEKTEYKSPENKIIFAPSWRNYLIGKSVNRNRMINIEKFKKSSYYGEIVKVLKDERLLRILKENKIVFDFKLHPIFEEYKKCFDEFSNDNIVISIGNTDLEKYKAFITDFSSFQFDFVRIKRPIIYFVPDMKEFRAGLHTYRNLDLEYDKAFGKLCLKGDELVNEIIKLINNGFMVDNIYKERMNKFFFEVENGKDILYETIKES